MTTNDDRQGDTVQIERGLEREQVEKLREKSTGEHWYWQPGWGLQYWKDGGVGLLIADGQEGAVTGHDFALIERAQDLADGWLEQHSRAEAGSEKVAGLEAKVERLRERVAALQNDHLRAIRAGRELRETDEHAGVMAVLAARTAHSVERNDALWVNPFEAQHLLAALTPKPAEAQAFKQLVAEWQQLLVWTRLNDMSPHAKSEAQIAATGPLQDTVRRRLADLENRVLDIDPHDLGRDRILPAPAGEEAQS